MISFNLNLRNPWSDKFKTLRSYTYITPFKNKFIELEFYKDSSVVSFNFNWTVRQSHAGLDLELGVFGYCVRFNFYDSRHWNYEKKAWKIYEEDLL